MNVTLNRIPPLAAAKVAAAIYGIFSLIFVPFMILGAVAGAQNGAAGAGVGIGMMILFPVFYVVAGFIMTLIMCAIYNVVARWIGGIQLEFDSSDIQMTQREV